MLIVAALTLPGCAEENAAFVPALMYHRISPDTADTPGHTLVPRTRFEDQMRYLAENGYTTATVSELAAYMREERTLPPRTVVLTFDDAWNEVLHAVPVLEKHGFKATFFVATEPLGEGYPGYLTWTQLQGLASNPDFEIGAHSVSHPWRLGDNLRSWLDGRPEGRSVVDVKLELEQPRVRFGEMLGEEPTVFAWPSGLYDERLVEMATRAGYDALVTTDETTNAPGDDPLRIGRYPVYGQFEIPQFEKLLAGEVERNAAELLPEGTPTGYRPPRDSTGPPSGGSDP